jgi:hypothetical protein
MTQDDDASVASLFDTPVGVIRGVYVTASTSPEVVVIMAVAALARVAPEVSATPPTMDSSTFEIYNSAESHFTANCKQQTD